ncbi:MAG TPA: hypothetical protein VNJ54_11410 [Plantibacter sp.]|uniref:hypothetical protein n=1 Tax=Plantibacter sp. TaxID=1871045 RepID=UPI002B894D0E|nr:hypothetical protein [Plantibacter sp.]
MPDPLNVGDPIDINDVDTDPQIEPTFATVADLMPPAVRRWVYALLPVALIVAATDIAPEMFATVTQIVAACGFGVAFSNVPKLVGR